jgi:hypothetical protein
METNVSIIPIYTKEEIQARIDAVELLNPNSFNEDTLKELTQFYIKSQSDAQKNVNIDEPNTYPCGCLGGPSGCSMCRCEIYSQAYAYRFHLYMHYFYK